MILYGKNSVFQRLSANPSSIQKVLIEDGFDEADILNIIKAKKISFKQVSNRELSKIKPGKNLQGIAVLVDKFEYADFDELLERDKVSLIFLDRIYDPQNLGAIIRIAACFGGFAIVIPKHKACEVTETVLHVACGGENFVSVAMVSNLANAVIKAKKQEYWIVGTAVKDAEDISKVKLPFPLGIVLGSEGEGVRYGIDKHLDLKVSIPMREAQLSFNVSGACAIFCYEIDRQRIVKSE